MKNSKQVSFVFVYVYYKFKPSVFGTYSTIGARSILANSWSFRP